MSIVKLDCEKKLERCANLGLMLVYATGLILFYFDSWGFVFFRLLMLVVRTSHLHGRVNWATAIFMKNVEVARMEMVCLLNLGLYGAS